MNLALVNPASKMPGRMSEFIAKIKSVGLQPPAVLTPGEIHRFAGIGKDANNQAGWCILFEDGLGGCFGDWSFGLQKSWQADQGRAFSRKERKRFQAQVAKAKKLAEEKKLNGHAHASIRAIEIWEKSNRTETDHPYLLKKGIQAGDARQYKNALVLRILDFDLKTTSLQFIDPDGSKRLLSGGKKKGCFIHVAGKFDGPKTILLCEGWATGRSLAELVPNALILAAIDAGNLEPVAIEARKKWPNAEIIIVADDDRLTEGNPGLTKAKAAALASKALLAAPKWPKDAPDHLSDFNDLILFYKGKGTTPPPFVEMTRKLEDDSWPELVSLDTPDLPKMPANLLPGIAGEFVQALADHTETPLELPFSMVLAVVSSAVARRFQVQVDPGYCEPCNLWFVTALPSGNRKSAVLSAATKPLIEWEHQKTQELAPAIQRIESERKTIEARINAKRNKAAKEKDDIEAQALLEEVADMEANLPEIPKAPRLWTSDATPEKMGCLLAEFDERMAWFSSEGGIFDLLEGRYSGGIPNLDLILKVHSGDAERVDRGSRPPVYLRHPLITIGLSPQPEVLRGLSSKPGFRGRGLLARFLYLLPVSPLGYRSLVPKPISPDISKRYNRLIHTLLEMEANQDENGDLVPHYLRLSQEARNEWQQFALSLEAQLRPGGELEHCTDWGSKAPGGAIRIAGVLHVIEHYLQNPQDYEITEETMSKALEIMAVILKHSLAALELTGADPTVASARRLWVWIQNQRLESFTIREAFNALRSRFPRVQKLKEALEVLEEQGYLRIAETATKVPGRPSSPTVQIRPEIMERWR